MPGETDNHNKIGVQLGIPTCSFPTHNGIYTLHTVAYYEGHLFCNIRVDKSYDAFNLLAENYYNNYNMSFEPQFKAGIKYDGDKIIPEANIGIGFKENQYKKLYVFPAAIKIPNFS